MVIAANENVAVRKIHQGRSEFTVVAPSGLLIEGAVAELATVVLREVMSGASAVVVDGEKLTYVSSTGFGTLMHLRGILKRRGGDLKLANLSPAVSRAVRILALTTQLDVWPRLEDAFHAFQRQAAIASAIRAQNSLSLVAA